MISHTAYFGDGEKTFTLTDTVIAELQHKTGVGIGALFRRVIEYREFRLTDITEIIRLGLIGGGVNPQEAQRLVDTYAKDRPIDETLPLALDILDARWNGKPEETVGRAIWTNSGDSPAYGDFVEFRTPHGEAASSGDMSAAINAALEQVPA